MEFLIDAGNSSLTGQALKDESARLTRYFLASLTLPEDDLWVNLSPYEKDRIVPDDVGRTEMGRDMLAQDYLLKQVSASLMDPTKELGKAFWDMVYQRAYDLYGTTDVPIDTFNKVWIMPGTAVVNEDDEKVIISTSGLRVMLDADYTALKKGKAEEPSSEDNNNGTDDALARGVARDVFLPAIEKEVNEGTNFSVVRQIYSAMILAAWYKSALKESIINRIYSDQHKTTGLKYASADQGAQNGPGPEVEAIYARYVESFRHGAVNLIREESDPFTGEILERKYFSGGLTFKGFGSKILQRVRNFAVGAVFTGVFFTALVSFSAPGQLQKNLSSAVNGDSFEVRPDTALDGGSDSLWQVQQDSLRQVSREEFILSQEIRKKGIQYGLSLSEKYIDRWWYGEWLVGLPLKELEAYYNKLDKLNKDGVLPETMYPVLKLLSSLVPNLMVQEFEESRNNFSPKVPSLSNFMPKKIEEDPRDLPSRYDSVPSPVKNLRLHYYVISKVKDNPVYQKYELDQGYSFSLLDKVQDLRGKSHKLRLGKNHFPRPETILGYIRFHGGNIYEVTTDWLLERTDDDIRAFINMQGFEGPRKDAKTLIEWKHQVEAVINNTDPEFFKKRENRKWRAYADYAKRLRENQEADRKLKEYEKKLDDNISRWMNGVDRDSLGLGEMYSGEYAAQINDSGKTQQFVDTLASQLNDTAKIVDVGGLLFDPYSPLHEALMMHPQGVQIMENALNNIDFKPLVDTFFLSDSTSASGSVESFVYGFIRTLSSDGNPVVGILREMDYAPVIAAAQKDWKKIWRIQDINFIVGGLDVLDGVLRNIDPVDIIKDVEENDGKAVEQDDEDRSSLGLINLLAKKGNRQAMEYLSWRNQGNEEREREEKRKELGERNVEVESYFEQVSNQDLSPLVAQMLGKERKIFNPEMGFDIVNNFYRHQVPVLQNVDFKLINDRINQNKPENMKIDLWKYFHFSGIIDDGHFKIESLPAQRNGDDGFDRQLFSDLSLLLQQNGISDLSIDGKITLSSGLISKIESAFGTKLGYEVDADGYAVTDPGLEERGRVTLMDLYNNILVRWVADDLPLPESFGQDATGAERSDAWKARERINIAKALVEQSWQRALQVLGVLSQAGFFDMKTLAPTAVKPTLDDLQALLSEKELSIKDVGKVFDLLNGTQPEEMYDDRDFQALIYQVQEGIQPQLKIGLLNYIFRSGGVDWALFIKRQLSALQRDGLLDLDKFRNSDDEALKRCGAYLDALDQGFLTVAQLTPENVVKLMDFRQNPGQRFEHDKKVFWVFPQADWNGAFNNDAKRIDEFLNKDYFVYLGSIGIDTDLEVLANDAGLHEGMKPDEGYDIVVISGHGSGSGQIQLGSAKNEESKISAKDEGVIKVVNDLLKPGGDIIINSCSGGFGLENNPNNAGNFFRDFIPRAGNIFSTPEPFSNFEIEFDDQGNIKKVIFKLENGETKETKVLYTYESSVAWYLTLLLIMSAPGFMGFGIRRKYGGRVFLSKELYGKNIFSALSSLLKPGLEGIDVITQKSVKGSSDAAQDLGGIDMSARNLDLKRTRGSSVEEKKIWWKDIALDNIQGLEPRIESLEPLAGVEDFLAPAHGVHPIR